MGFRFHRSVKLLPGIRLNFGKRGISTSIGVRGAHITFGSTGTRSTVGLPGSGLSYTHLERPHRHVSTAMTAAPTNSEVSQGFAGPGFLWIGLIAAVLVSIVGRTPTPARSVQMPNRTLAAAAAHTANETIHEKAAEIKSAALGVAQIRHTVANSSTLSLSRVTVMSKGAICYQFHLRNSHGVAYVRTAMMEGPELTVSGSKGFAALWNNRCVHESGREITSDVNEAIRR